MVPNDATIVPAMKGFLDKQFG